MKNGFLICFVGIDGSGKSTQAHKLKSFLTSRKIKAKYVWNRFEPRILKPFIKLAKIIFFQRKTMYNDYNQYMNIKNGLLLNPGVSIIFEYFSVLEYLLQTLLQVRIPILYTNVICDRYLYDFVVGLGSDLNYSRDKIRRMLDLCLLLLPKPDMVFLLDLPEETAFRRKTDIPSVAYVRRRRRIFLDIAKEYKMNILDGLKAEAELKNIMLNKIKAELI